MSGQSVLDRVTAAKHTITGSDLAKSVCKATTAEVMGPKKKHLDYLLQCTMTEHINIPELADLIIERTTNTNWVIVYKALSTCHNLMIYGHERFIQYLATRTVVFSLEAFMDKANVQGYDMSTYIRRYSKYLNQKALSYRTVAFDFCRVKRGKEEGKLRTMQAEKLLKTLPILQDQMDALLSFEISQNDLSNGIINGSFMLLFKDVIRLFACYNDGIINLLEKFFEMNKKDCKQALDIYKKFLTRMERVAEFLKIAEKVGIDKGEIPDLAQFLDVPAEYKSAPSTLLDALEAHLASLDSKKAWTKPASVSLAVSAFANSVSHIDSHEKRQAIEEEKERLAALKVAASADQSTTDLFSAQPLNVALKNTNAKQMQDQNDVQKAPQQVTPAHNNPFLSSPTTSPVHQPTTTAVSRDIFGAPPQGTVTQPSSTKLSSDLIGLTPSAMSPSLQAQLGQPRMPNQAQWGASNVLTATSSSPLHITAAGSPIRACASAPGSYKESFEPFGNAQTRITNNNDIGANFDKVFTGNSQQNANTQELFGDILQPMNSTGQPQRVPENPVTTNETGDLDTTLSKLATNISLDIRGSMSPKKAAPMSMEFELHGSQRLKSDHQWNKQSSNMAGSRTGGAAWQPVQMASTTWPQQQPYMEPAGQAQIPQMGMGPRPVGAQPGMVGMYPQGAPGQHAGAGYPQQQPRMAQQQQQPNDPFGNL
ncbi:phosphatidylinositol-binding clathrin assembly protein LAP-like isoform X10 [Asterias rubens]|uniref:phosphatidylinositol-binding clathrin assembly protein LAP-like isoform X10 n=1 Tax=Asterias rubens TaxID=7604 RepID=UPI001455801B|nr:phosphatidylinositol-binding clathrin assembly protein LAP-like isoform X10 [Asterias rubens]